MALDFPTTPTPGQKYPANPGVSGVTQYIWDNTKGVWNAALSTVSLGTINQSAYNSYQWPLTDGLPDQQLTTDGAGNLLWDVPAAPTIQVLGLDGPFDGTRVAFTLIDLTISTPFIPVPSTNIVIFLGGVPQLPAAAYSITPATSTIIFTEAPLAGTSFYAISNVIA